MGGPDCGKGGGDSARAPTAVGGPGGVVDAC